MRAECQAVRVGLSSSGPIFLLDGGDVVVFEDVVALCHEVEAWMVDQPVEFYDADARPLRLVVDGRRTVGVEQTTNPARTERLRAALMDFLAATQLEVGEDGTSPEFVRAAAEAIISRQSGTR